MKTKETMEAVSSDGMEKRVERRNWRQIGPCAREKPSDAKKKSLPICGAGRESRKITKKVHAGRGSETKWEMSAKTAKCRLDNPTTLAHVIHMIHLTPKEQL